RFNPIWPLRNANLIKLVEFFSQSLFSTPFQLIPYKPFDFPMVCVMFLITTTDICYGLRMTPLDGQGLGCLTTFTNLSLSKCDVILLFGLGDPLCLYSRSSTYFCFHPSKANLGVESPYIKEVTLICQLLHDALLINLKCVHYHLSSIATHGHCSSLIEDTMHTLWDCLYSRELWLCYLYFVTGILPPYYCGLVGLEMEEPSIIFHPLM
ncbi:hypothetical protein CR513_14177, partial [Mucuna pruriens]